MAKPEHPAVGERLAPFDGVFYWALLYIVSGLWWLQIQCFSDFFNSIRLYTWLLLSFVGLQIHVTNEKLCIRRQPCYRLYIW